MSMLHPMAEPETTEDLVRRARQGDREAFDEIEKRHEAALRRSIEARIGAEVRKRIDVDDLLQETFLAAFRSIDSLQWRGDDAFVRWLRQIAEHRIHDAAKGRAPTPDLELVREVAAHGVSPSRAVRREERMQRLERALGRLSPDHAEVVRLVKIEGLKIREVAERMGRSETAVKNLLIRALGALRDAFGETGSLHLPARTLKIDEGLQDQPRLQDDRGGALDERERDLDSKGHRSDGNPGQG